MHFVLDLLLIGVGGFLLFRGWRRGFAAWVLHGGRLLLSLVITLTGGGVFSAWIHEAWIYPAIYERVQPKFANLATAADGSLEALISKIPSAFRPYIHESTADSTDNLYQIADEWSSRVSQGLSEAVASAIGHIFLFLLSYILLTIIIFFLRNLTKLPIVHTVDRVLGLVLGGISGLFAVVLLSAVTGAFLEILGQGDIADRSLILSLFERIREGWFDS